MQKNRNIIFKTFRDWNLKLYQKRLNNPAYLDLKTNFKEHKILEDNYRVIKNEIQLIINKSKDLPKFHEVDNGQEYISDNDGVSWSLFNVKLYGMWHKENMQKCPKTVALLSNMGSVKSIYFSILDPGKHIPPHNGPYKGILRYQLALSVPKTGNCELIVDNKSFHWEEGKSVMFDDTFVHEVKNETNEKRMALLLDIKREDLKGFLYYYDKLIVRIIQFLLLLNKTFTKSRV